MLLDDAQISGIDLYNGEVLDPRIVGDDFRPGAGGKADHKHIARMRGKKLRRIGAKETVVVVDKIEIKHSVIGAAAKDHAAGGHVDHATTGFHGVFELHAVGVNLL